MPVTLPSPPVGQPKMSPDISSVPLEGKKPNFWEHRPKRKWQSSQKEKSVDWGLET